LPVVRASMRIWKRPGHASGQSQWAMAETAYATLDRTLLIDSFSPRGRICRIASFAYGEFVKYLAFKTDILDSAFISDTSTRVVKQCRT